MNIQIISRTEKRVTYKYNFNGSVMRSTVKPETLDAWIAKGGAKIVEAI